MRRNVDMLAASSPLRSPLCNQRLPCRTAWRALACGQRAVQCFTTAPCAALVVICAALRENLAEPRRHVRFGESQHDWTRQIDLLLPRAVATGLSSLSNWVQWGMNKKAV